jgi:type 1 glutamine amidotransferase
MSQQAFFLYGGWPGHEPYGAGEFGVEVLHELGFEVDATMDTYRLEDDLSDYSVLVLAWTQSLLTEGLTVAQEDGLLGAVESGVGLAGWHGMTASFRASIRYHHLIGGTFVGHPGDLIPYRVEIVDHDHEITEGVDDFDVVSENYYMHVDPSNHVLARSTFSGEPMPWVKGVEMPQAWTRPWGSGRVFYSSVGHTPAELRIPSNRRMIAQGIRWAARGQ